MFLTLSCVKSMQIDADPWSSSEFIDLSSIISHWNFLQADFAWGMVILTCSWIFVCLNLSLNICISNATPILNVSWMMNRELSSPRICSLRRWLWIHSIISSIVYHTSHIIHQASNIKHHTSYIIYHISQINYHSPTVQTNQRLARMLIREWSWIAWIIEICDKNDGLNEREMTGDRRWCWIQAQESQLNCQSCSVSIDASQLNDFYLFIGVYLWNDHVIIGWNPNHLRKRMNDVDDEIKIKLNVILDRFCYELIRCDIIKLLDCACVWRIKTRILDCPQNQDWMAVGKIWNNPNCLSMIANHSDQKANNSSSSTKSQSDSSFPDVFSSIIFTNWMAVLCYSSTKSRSNSSSFWQLRWVFFINW
jgi:hypothetical protein